MDNNALCMFCNKSYGEHTDSVAPDAPPTKASCLHLKTGFIPREVSPRPVPTPTIVTLLTFPQAMEKILDGASVRRESWENREEHCTLKDGWLSIFIKGKWHQWIISDGDLMADDWIELFEHSTN